MNIISTIVSLSIIVIFSVVVVMQKLELTRTGYELGKSEKEYRRLAEINRQLGAELSRQTSYDEVKRKVEEFGLPLEAPGKKDKQDPR